MGIEANGCLYATIEDAISTLVLDFIGGDFGCGLSADRLADDMIEGWRLDQPEDPGDDASESWMTRHGVSRADLVAAFARVVVA
jgi:hypothetical protein